MRRVGEGARPPAPAPWEAGAGAALALLVLGAGGCKVSSRLCSAGAAGKGAHGQLAHRISAEGHGDHRRPQVSAQPLVGPAHPQGNVLVALKLAGRLPVPPRDAWPREVRVLLHKPRGTASNRLLSLSPSATPCREHCTAKRRVSGTRATGASSFCLRSRMCQRQKERSTPRYVLGEVPAPPVLLSCCLASPC